MGFLRRIFGGGSDADDPTSHVETPPEGMLTASDATFEAYADRARVSVWLRLRDAAFEDEREQQRVFGLEDRVMRALDASGAGEHDTNALEPGYFCMRLVGDDADAVVKVVLPLLSEAPAGSYLAVRQGGAGSPEDRIDLGSPARRPSAGEAPPAD